MSGLAWTKAGVLVAYSARHSGAIVGAGALAGTVQRCLRWNQWSRGMLGLKPACGVLVLVGGLYVIGTA